jgi:choloylglycine hydrolase
VLEYTSGELRVYNNSQVGVLTNDPSYEWHLGNLDQFAAFPSAPVAPSFQYTVQVAGPFADGGAVPVVTPGANGGSDGRLNGGTQKERTTTVPVDVSHGFNTRFLPGSYTPADRFVRMFLLKQLAVAHSPPRSLVEGLSVATGLINKVHIVRGTVSVRVIKHVHLPNITRHTNISSSRLI